MSKNDAIREALCRHAADVRAWSESLECLTSRLRSETRAVERGDQLNCDLAEISEVSCRLQHSVAALNAIALVCSDGEP